MLALSDAQAQSNTPPGRRYLLIVETSKAMGRRIAGLDQVVRDLLSTGLHGEMRQGDTLGVWTFNDTLFTGQLRLQHFSPAAQPAMATEVLGFLNGRKYERSPQWGAVIPALSHVVQSSSLLTVIIVTTGTEAINGTPFNMQINQAIDSWREPQESARMPLVIVLRAGRGKLTDFAVSAAPWKVTMPPLPPEPQVAAHTETATAPRPATPAAPKTPAPVVAPLYFTGRRPQPVEPMPNSPAAAATEPASVQAPIANAAPSSVPVQNPTTAPVSNAPPQFEHTARSASTSPTVSSELPTATPHVAQAQPAGQSPSIPEADLGAAATVRARSETSDNDADAAALKVRDQDSVAPMKLASATPHAASKGFLVLWLSAGGGLGLALLAMFLLWKRSRMLGHVSLITRSLERQQQEREKAGLGNGR